MKTPATYLLSANASATVLENLKAGAPVRTAINRVLNEAFTTQLASALKAAKMDSLAQLVAKFRPANIAEKNSLSIRSFVREQLETLRNVKPATARSAKAEAAKLSQATTLRTALQLNLALGSHPLFQADIKRAQVFALLDTSPALASKKLQGHFVEALLANKGPIAAFWQQLAQNDEFKALVPAIQLTLQLGALTSDNIPLVKALQGVALKRAFVTLQDFVRVDAADWITLITTPVDGQKIAVPSGTAGSTPAEQASAYAGVLSSALRSAYPTHALAADIAVSPGIDAGLVQAVLKANPGLDPSQPMPVTALLSGVAAPDQPKALASMAALRAEINIFPTFDYQSALGLNTTGTQGAVPASFVNSVRQAVASFLTNAPEFDFQSDNVDAFLAANSAALAQVPQADRAALVAQLKTIQRVYRITSDYPTLSMLLTEGIDSAYAAARMPAQAFVQQFSGPLGGVDAAEAVQSKARYIDSQAAALFLRIKDGLGLVNPSTIGLFGGNVQTVLEQNSINFPNWQTLFGPTGYCECPDCMAVDGPSAYFADLLQFLGNSAPNVPVVPPNSTGSTMSRTIG